MSNSSENIRARIRFSKYGAIRYVGHLDMLRYFQKAMRRAEIPIAYSTGFSPHQIMSFAAPLGVGVTSDGEYVDIEITSHIDPDDAIKRLNNVMAEGVIVREFKYLSDDAPKAMAAVTASDYIVYFKDIPDTAVATKFIPGYSNGDNGQTGLKNYNGQISLRKVLTDKDIANALVRDFMSRDSIVITKQTKKSVRQLDLKPLIYSLEAVTAEQAVKLSPFNTSFDEIIPDYRENGFFLNDTDVVFHISVSTGSIDNIKPELVIQKMLEITLDSELSDDIFGIHRFDMVLKSGK